MLLRSLAPLITAPRAQQQVFRQPHLSSVRSLWSLQACYHYSVSDHAACRLPKPLRIDISPNFPVFAPTPVVPRWYVSGDAIPSRSSCIDTLPLRRPLNQHLDCPIHLPKGLRLHALRGVPRRILSPHEKNVLTSLYHRQRRRQNVHECILRITGDEGVGCLSSSGHWTGIWRSDVCVIATDGFSLSSYLHRVLHSRHGWLIVGSFNAWQRTLHLRLKYLSLALVKLPWGSEA